MNSYIYENHNTKSFYNMAWVAFAVSFVGMLVGLYYLDADLAMKGFLAMSFLFCLVSCITLSKVIRDKHEAERFINKIAEAKTEKFLNESVVG
jgi:hypothetical protein